MIFTAENTLLIGSILLFVSIVVGKTGYRFGVPTLLLFLVVGMLFGSDGLGLQFHDAKDAQFIGMVALSIILFSGGMDTKFREIKPILGPGIVIDAKSGTSGAGRGHFRSRYRAFYRRSSTNRSFHRIIYLVAVRNELDEYLSAYHHVIATGIYHVLYGLGFGVRHPAFAEDESETQPPPHAGAGKWK